MRATISSARSYHSQGNLRVRQTATRLLPRAPLPLRGGVSSRDVSHRPRRASKSAAKVGGRLDVSTQSESTGPKIFQSFGNAKKSVPPPPPAPEELMTISLVEKAPYLFTSLFLTGVSVISAHHFLEAGDSLVSGLAFCFLGGMASVPLAFYPHDVMHMRRSSITPAHTFLAFWTSIVTGCHWGAGPDGVHVNHHAATGSYKGTVAPPEVKKPRPMIEGDQDDLWLLIRKGTRYSELAKNYSAVHAAMVAGSAAASILLFQPMFILQSLRYGIVSEAKGEGCKPGRQALCSTLIHLALGLAMLGPVGYLFFSIGISLPTQSTVVPAHDPRGVSEAKEGNYWYEVMKSTRNLQGHGNPLIMYLFNGTDYHIEHHLWESVPPENLHKLAPLAKKYFEDNGMPYREVGLKEAWADSLEVGKELAKKPVDKCGPGHLN